MSTTQNILAMEFTLGNGKTKTIRISNPKSTLTAAEVESAMNTLNDLKAFHDFEFFGSNLKGAKTIQTVTNKFDIVIN